MKIYALATLVVSATVSPAIAETQLDRAVELCRSHISPVGNSWSATSLYDVPGYGHECQKVFSLWNKRNTENTLDMIRQGIAKPDASLSNVYACNLEDPHPCPEPRAVYGGSGR